MPRSVGWPGSLHWYIAGNLPCNVVGCGIIIWYWQLRISCWVGQSLHPTNWPSSRSFNNRLWSVSILAALKRSNESLVSRLGWLLMVLPCLTLSNLALPYPGSLSLTQPCSVLPCPDALFGLTRRDENAKLWFRQHNIAREIFSNMLTCWKIC